MWIRIRIRNAELIWIRVHNAEKRVADLVLFDRILDFLPLQYVRVKILSVVANFPLGL